MSLIVSAIMWSPGMIFFGRSLDPLHPLVVTLSMAFVVEYPGDLSLICKNLAMIVRPDALRFPDTSPA